MYSLKRFSDVCVEVVSLVAVTRLVERNENGHTPCAMWSFGVKQLEFWVPLKEDLTEQLCSSPSVLWSIAVGTVQRSACCLSPCQASSWRRRCWCYVQTAWRVRCGENEGKWTGLTVVCMFICIAGKPLYVPSRRTQSRTISWRCAATKKLKQIYIHSFASFVSAGWVTLWSSESADEGA